MTRDGSGNSLKHHVWGTRYVDELCQVTVLGTPGPFGTPDVHYWACQDSNYNVLGVVDGSAVLAERYEYTPYGQRTAFFSPGSNDVGCYAPTQTSRRVTQGGVDKPFALCEVGHQGLLHDEEVGLVYNRARQLHPGLGRFVQRDPLGYVDGQTLFQYLQSAPIATLDPLGYGGFTNSCTEPKWVFCGDGDPPWKLVQPGETRECGEAFFDPFTEPGRSIYKWIDCWEVKCEGHVYHTTWDPGGGENAARRCCCMYPPCAVAGQALRGGWGNAGDPDYPPTPPPGCYPIPNGWHCEYPDGI